MRLAQCLVPLLTVAALAAADGPATQPAPAPAAEGPKAGAARPVQLPMSMGRSPMVYEVESLQITPGDAAGMAAWAEYAAQGFHLVAATAADGKQTLFFERSRAPGAVEVRLPAAVAADAAQAAAVQAKLQRIISDRQPSRPAPAPAPAAPEGK